jgi:hypothetical protein
LERSALCDGDRQVVAGQRDVPDRGEYCLLAADGAEDRLFADPGPIGIIIALVSYLIAIGVVVILGAVIRLVWHERSLGQSEASDLPLSS